MDKSTRQIDWRSMVSSVTLTAEAITAPPEQAWQKFFDAKEDQHKRMVKEWPALFRELYGPYRSAPRVHRGSKRKFKRKVV